MKKSIWAAIFVNSALALAFAVYTVVAIATGLGGKKAAEPQVLQKVLALRVNDAFPVQGDSVEFEGMDDKLKLVNGEYVAAKEGSFKCTVTNNDNSKVVYDVTIYGYGEGTPQNPYNITKASHLFDLDGNGSDIHDKLTSSFIMRADIDMTGVEWIPVGSLLPRSFSAQINKNGENYTAIDEATLSSLSSASRFKGSFNGNGYSIKNLTIDVTKDNFEKYAVFKYTANGTNTGISSVYLYVGFFGLADGAAISNVNFDNSKITVAAELTNGTAVIKSTDVAYPNKDQALNIKNEVTKKDGTINALITVGTVAGTVYNSNISSVSAENGKVEAGTGQTNNSGVGTIAGFVRYSKLSIVSVLNCELVANSGCTFAGGVVGYVGHEIVAENSKNFFKDVSVEKQTILSNVVVNGLKVTGDAYKNSVTAGVVAIGRGIVLKDSKVENLSINLNKNTDNTENEKISTNVAGVVGYLYDIVTKSYNASTGAGAKLSALMENVSVVGADIKAKDQRLVVHDAAGVVAVNQGELKDVTFAGVVTGLNISGLVLENEGKITYTKEIDGFAVDCTLNNYVAAAAVACYNYNGTIEGVASKTKINAKIENHVQTTAEYEANTKPESYFVSAGIVAFTKGGTVKNFDVKAYSNNPINFGGAIGYVGGTQGTAVSKGYTFAADNSYTTGQALVFGDKSVAENIITNSDVYTRRYGMPFSTIYVGGVAAGVYENSEVKSVVTNINVNKFDGADGNTLTAEIAAGVAAFVDGKTNTAEKKTVIDDVKLGDIYIFVNYSIKVVEVGETEPKTQKQLSYVAGAFGSVEGAAIEIKNISRASESLVTLINQHKQIGAALVYDEYTGAYGFIAAAKGTDSSNKIVISNVSLANMKVIAHFVACKTMIAASNTDGYNGIVAPDESIEVTSETGKKK